MWAENRAVRRGGRRRLCGSCEPVSQHGAADPPGSSWTAPGLRDGRLGAVGRGGGVGFLEIFIGDLVRLGGSTQRGQPGHDGDRFVGPCQDTDGGLMPAPRHSARWLVIW